MEEVWSYRIGSVVRGETPPQLSKVEVKGLIYHQEQHPKQLY